MKVAMLFLAGALASDPLSAQPGNLRNARTTLIAAEPGGLARQFRELSSDPSPRWIGWAAPAEDPRQRMCCGERWNDAARCCGRCRLEREGSSFTNRDEKSISRLESPGEFLLLARVAKGKVQKLRHFSLDCEIDAGGMPVVWLEGVVTEESIAWLETLTRRRIPEDDDSDDARLVDDAIASIAFHAGPEAQAAMVRRIAKEEPHAIREKGAFWLAAARGRAGCAILRGAVPPDPDEEFRKHGTFALSLCKEEGGVETLLRMARRDPAGEVRGQALFWLAQKAGRKAAGAIDEAIRDDPDTEVKKQAVFALTQMPDGQGVTELIRVARTNRNPEVREQAVFWLGQSKDPRALEFIEEILTR